MALQMAPIKASRRKILSNLNAEHYQRSQKSRQSERVGAGRKKLVNVSTAKKIARQKSARQIQRGNVYTNRAMNEAQRSGAIDLHRGEQLKRGIESLARKSEDVTEDQRWKLNQMDPAKLDRMYQNNDLIFEVYFQYNKTEEGANNLSDKYDDVQFLIDEYERIYGVTL